MNSGCVTLNRMTASVETCFNPNFIDAFLLIATLKLLNEESKLNHFNCQFCWIFPEVSVAPYWFRSCSATPLVHPNPTYGENKTAERVLVSMRENRTTAYQGTCLQKETNKTHLITVMRVGTTMSMSVLSTSSKKEYLNRIFSSTTRLAFSTHIVLSGRGRTSPILSQIVLWWCLKVDWIAEASEDSPFQTWLRTFCMPTTWSWSSAEPNQKRASERPPKAIWTNLK